LSLTTRALASPPAAAANSRRFAFERGSASTRPLPVSQAAPVSRKVTGARPAPGP
jgi:hypothetical protein